LKSQAQQLAASYGSAVQRAPFYIHRRLFLLVILIVLVFILVVVFLILLFVVVIVVLVLEFFVREAFGLPAILIEQDFVDAARVDDDALAWVGLKIGVAKIPLGSLRRVQQKPFGLSVDGVGNDEAHNSCSPKNDDIHGRQPQNL